MYRILTGVFLLWLAFFSLAGCWTSGSITEGMPRHTVKLAHGAALYVEKTEPRVYKALCAALTARGFALAEKEADAAYVLSVKVERWEYNDAGFSGFHDRDDMDLSATVRNPHTQHIHSRTTISVRSDFKILDKFVEML